MARLGELEPGTLARVNSKYIYGDRAELVGHIVVVEEVHSYLDRRYPVFARSLATGKRRYFDPSELDIPEEQTG